MVKDHTFAPLNFGTLPLQNTLGNVRDSGTVKTIFIAFRNRIVMKIQGEAYTRKHSRFIGTSQEPIEQRRKQFLLKNTKQ